MTNYEKYNKEIIDILVNGTTCSKLRKLQGYDEKCSNISCSTCVPKLKKWLEAEAEEFDPAELKAGDKIVMREYGGNEFSEFEVVCNSFPACWLRFRESENGTPKADNDFLIFYDDFVDKYDIKEVVSE